MCFVVGIVNKLRLWNEGAPKYLEESVTGTGIWVKEKMTRFGCSHSNCRILAVTPADAQMNYGVSSVHVHSGFPAGRSELTIVTPQNEVTVISHAILGGKYKRRAHTNLSDCHLGFLVLEWLGLLISHRPSTLAISVPVMEKSITRKNCVFYLSICMYPDLFGELFSQYDFSCLTVSWVGHYLHPLEPGIQQVTDHNPLAADCKGRINH